MRPEKKCIDKTKQEYRYHRMHYCGTCKTIGQEYGQRSRLLLNFDTVFFAELLSHLNQENLSKWQPGYQAINQCFKMPDQNEESPFSLKYAAATNVLLGQLKLDDQLKDLPGIKWKLARQFYSKPFRKANQQFQNWGIDTRYFWEWINKQSEIEQKVRTDFSSLAALLNHYAKPTAQITGGIFEKGASLSQQGKVEKEMYQLGYQFGRLNYILDAFEDIEKDLRQDQFNPLVLYFNIDQSVQEEQLEEVRLVILEHQKMVVDHLKKLPIPQEMNSQYTVRLQSNIALRIYKEREVIESFPNPTKVDWADFKKKLALVLSTQIRTANYYLVSLTVFLFPLAVDLVSRNQSDQVEMYKWSAIFLAVLGIFGLGKSIKKNQKEKLNRREKRKLRKVKRRVRLLERVKNIFKKKRGFWDECCSSCCESCINDMCDFSCDFCCDIMREGFSEGKFWPILVIFFLILAIVLLLVLV
jgi:hypothetical protein